MTPEQLMRVHTICQLVREREPGRHVCHECPETVTTPYGNGTQGCFLLASELYRVATCEMPQLPQRRSAEGK